MKNLSKTQKRIPISEYTSREWYEQQLAQDWYIADAENGELVMQKMSENGYGSTTAQQASIQKYGSIWELNKQQIQVLLGKDYREELFQDWEQRRQQPLKEYKEWLSRRV